ncbi:hypothetical protein BDV97DRAFT_387052 [Delphinella strobiligena]|nr:hypothetical protein BDV97DRAFT_387052 [Delphinella strobiligena]
MHRCAQGFANARNPSTVISITVSLHLEILSGDIISVPLTRLSLTSSEIMGRSNDAAKGTEEILDDDYFVKQYQQMTNKGKERVQKKRSRIRRDHAARVEALRASIESVASKPLGTDRTKRTKSTTLFEFPVYGGDTHGHSVTWQIPPSPVVIAVTNHHMAEVDRYLTALPTAKILMSHCRTGSPRSRD